MMQLVAVCNATVTISAYCILFLSSSPEDADVHLSAMDCASTEFQRQAVHPRCQFHHVQLFLCPVLPDIRTITVLDSSILSNNAASLAENFPTFRKNRSVILVELPKNNSPFATTPTFSATTL
jgi:hypothetical protein